MTSRKGFARFSVVALLALGVAAPAGARQSQPAVQAPRPVTVQPSVSQQRFRQAVQQSQVRDQLQKNQVEHQLRQTAAEQTRRPPGSATANDSQVDKVRQAQDQLYNAQQRDSLQRYTEAVMPQPVPPAKPAPAEKKDDGGR